jgi:hypothetical protein
MHFGPQNLFLIISSQMAQRGRNLMAIDQDYAVDVAELFVWVFLFYFPVSIFRTQRTDALQKFKSEMS